MQIVVLAGGLATRLYPVTKNIPKSLIPVLDKPFVDYQLKLFKKNGITDVVFCIGHFGEQIKKHVGNGSRYGLKVKYSPETERLDTGGALYNARIFLNDKFFTIYGDSYLDIDYRTVMRSYKSSGKLGLMTVWHNKNKIEPSRIVVKNKLVKDYRKEPPPPGAQYAEYGLNIFSKKIFEFFEPKIKSFPISEYFKALFDKDELAAFPINERFYEVGNLIGIRDLENHLSNGYPRLFPSGKRAGGFRLLNVVSRTPFRIPLGGGGTDTDHVNKLIGGSWGAAAISLFVDVTVADREDDRIRIRVGNTDQFFENIDQVKTVHPLIYECLKRTGLGMGLEITATANVSSSAGVGGSGSLVVGLLHCLYQIIGRQFTKLQLALDAFQIECDLGYPIGPQDQIAAALGGIHWVTRNRRNGKVNIERLYPERISQDTVSALEEDLMMFDTGLRHRTSEVLAEEKSNLTKSQTSKQALAQWHEVKRLGLRRRTALISSDLEKFGLLLDQHCQNKLNRTNSAVNQDLMCLYDQAKLAGAIGGYPIGAGQGGFFIILALGYKEKMQVRNVMNKLGLKERHWKFDLSGTQLLICDII